MKLQNTMDKEMIIQLRNKHDGNVSSPIEGFLMNGSMVANREVACWASMVKGFQGFPSGGENPCVKPFQFREKISSSHKVRDQGVYATRGNKGECGHDRHMLGQCMIDALVGIQGSGFLEAKKAEGVESYWQYPVSLS